VLPALIISQLTLSRLSLLDAKRAYDEEGSAEAALKYISSLLPADYAALERRAQEEVTWCESHKVRIVPISNPDYPRRLRECCDAPLVLFVRGTADLNASKMLSIVGTRKNTPYSTDCINGIVDTLAESCPDTHIVSGLAYGVDITAHRAALRNNLPTIGVVAHGQGMLYPAPHRSEANKMVLGNGAVITEFFHDVRPEARNFLQRNRIIAGLSDATLVPESAIHGGGMVTARLAVDYNRELFAIPGNVTAPMSEGPNALIRDNKAALVTSAADIIKDLGWHAEEIIQQARNKGIERELFTEFTDDERKVVEALQKGDQTTDTLCSETGLPISTLSTVIFTLEMKGIIRALSGNQYHLVNG
jgi:DNA processing protein